MASLRFWLSRVEGGRRRGVTRAASAEEVTIVTCWRLIERLEGVARASRGIVRGDPVPRAMGETLSDWSAEMVQASMSMAELDAVVAGKMLAIAWLGGGDSGGGGTALYMAMVVVDDGDDIDDTGDSLPARVGDDGRETLRGLLFRRRVCLSLLELHLG